MPEPSTILGSEQSEVREVASFICFKCGKQLDVSHGGGAMCQGLTRCVCGVWNQFKLQNNLLVSTVNAKTPVRVCPKCGALSGFRRLWDWPLEGISDDNVSCLDECASCGIVAYFRSSRDGQIVHDQYPTRVHAPQAELPVAVKTAYAEALVCLGAGAPNGALLMCRRAIQEALNDLGAKKGDLPTQLNDLVSKYRITPNLRDWADHARIGGKLAGHGTGGGEWGNASKVTGGKEDAEAVIEFCNGFFEYVYVLPKRNEERRTKTGILSEPRQPSPPAPDTQSPAPVPGTQPPTT